MYTTVTHAGAHNSSAPGRFEQYLCIAFVLSYIEVVVRISFVHSFAHGQFRNLKTAYLTFYVTLFDS